MATKAQMFRSAEERKVQRPPKVKKPRRIIDAGHTDTRNVTKRGDKAVGMALEDSASGRPSRKSSRASSHGGRADTQLMKAARDRSLTPKARAKRAQTERK